MAIMPDILIVDDEEHIRKLYTDFLTREGYNVMSVASGDEALSLTAQNSFDLVILDIELEDIGGMEVLKRMKSDHPEITIILNTAFSIYKSDFNTWLADAYLMKSSDIKTLKDKIEELILV
jgi:DNA-binding response OmpR family regulator